jgi:hypothetical protein
MASYKAMTSLLEVSSLEQPLAKVERAARKREASQMLVEQIVLNWDEEGVEELPGAHAEVAEMIGEMHDCKVVLLFRLLRVEAQPVLTPDVGIKELAVVPEDCAKTAAESRDITVREVSIVF